MFIPRAQPLCRPVTLPTALRGETEGILSFLPSIPVKSFIIQLPDYLKKLRRLWFSSVCVSGRESVGEWGVAGDGMHPVANTNPTSCTRRHPHPLCTPLSYTHFPSTPWFYKTFSGGELPPPLLILHLSFCALSFLLICKVFICVEDRLTLSFNVSVSVRCLVRALV